MAGRRTNEQIITDLVSEGSTLLAAAHEHNIALTDTYKRLAGVIVTLRSKFKDSNGDPDWRGRTQEYRNTVQRMYEESGVPADSQTNMQAAIRYHIGNVLRDRLSAEDLAKAGLKAEGPLERSRSNNRRTDREAADRGDATDEEWFDDTVTTLKSLLAEHEDEVILVDLRDPKEDVLPMLHKCLTIMQQAHLEGVTPDTKAAAIAVLDQVLAEAAAFRAEAAQVQEAERRRGRQRSNA